MKFDRILPNLFLGPAPVNQPDFEQLRMSRVTAILSLQSADDFRADDVERRRSTASNLGLTFRHVPVIDFDRTELRRKLRACVGALDDLLKRGETVYLHCTAGVNRSPTVAAAFLHWRLGWNLERAVAHIQSLRNCCPDSEVILGSDIPR